MAKKDTYIKSAQKFLQKGQLDRAIKEYYRALDFDPKDYRIRHKLGELLTRQGSRGEAINELTVVAEAYSKDGFYLKAIAVYKQIIKLKPDLYDIHLKAGNLYHQLSLMSEAMEHYQFVADYYETEGTSRECLEVFRRIVDLKGDDVHAKLKLAEYHVREQENEQAIKLYYSVASELKEKHRTEELIRVYERLIQLDPTNLSTYKDIAELYLEVREPRNALAKLQICFKADSSDARTLHLLGETFLAMDQLPKAKSVYKELARIYAYQGFPDKQREVFDRIHRVDPSDPEVVEALYGKSPPGQGKKEPAAPDVMAAPPLGSRPIVARPVGARGPDMRGPALVAPPESPPTPKTPAAPPIATNQPAALPPPLPVLQQSSEGQGLWSVPESVAKLMAETEVYLNYKLFEKANSHLGLILEREPSCYVAREKRRELLAQQARKEEAAAESAQMSLLASKAGDQIQARLDLERAVELDPMNLQYQHALASLSRMVSMPPPTQPAPARPIPTQPAPVKPPPTPPAPAKPPPTEAAPHFFSATSAADVQIEDEEEPSHVSLNANFMDDIELVDDVDEVQSVYLTLTGNDMFFEPVDDHAAGGGLPFVDDSSVAATTDVGQPGAGRPTQTSTPVVIVSRPPGDIFSPMDKAGSARVFQEMDELVDDEPAAVATPFQEIDELVDDEPPLVPSFQETDELVDDDGELDLVQEIEFELSTPDDKKRSRRQDKELHSIELAQAYYQMGLYDDAIQEIERVREPPPSAEAIWLLGRCRHHKGELDDAVRLYQTVLNRTDLSETQELAILFDLGLAYEAQGEFNLALDLFDEIVSIDDHFRQKEVNGKLTELSARISQVKNNAMPSAR